MEPIILSGNQLTIDQVIAVTKGFPVSLDPSVIPSIQRSRLAVERLISENRIAYGITTGFGRFKDKVITAEQVKQLQVNLLRSHAVGVGPLLDDEIVRAMMLVRANTLALGFSGVRIEVIQLLIDMLNHSIHPCIPSQGSLGASGDLAPLAHMGLVMIGEGTARYHGQVMNGAEALAQCGLNPLQLGPKEGLAIINGTSQMVGMGALTVHRAANLSLTADIAACLSIEALYGTDRALDPRVHELRPHPRQIDCAAFMRKVLQGSQMLRSNDPFNVQDAYTLRCVPQVHGAIRDAIAYTEWVIGIEMNSVNDNPIIFCDQDNNEIDVISAGNFHGEPVAIAMDYLKLALTELGNMSERRIARLVDADSNGGILPMFLTEHGGLESGMMIAQYTAAALASENKVLAHPASADSIPTSANVEDHVSMGATAVRQAQQILEHAEMIITIELILAAQGIDFRKRSLPLNQQQQGKGTSAAYHLIRQNVPFLQEDTSLAPYIEKVRQKVADGSFAAISHQL